NNPGQFRIRVWTYYKHTSMTHAAIRVIPNGAGGDLFDISNTYNYNVGPFGPFADGSTNVGSWQPDQGWTGSRAWWVYNYILNAFFFPWDQVPPGQAAGSRQPDGATAEWQADSTAGTFFDYNHV